MTVTAPSVQNATDVYRVQAIGSGGLDSSMSSEATLTAYSVGTLPAPSSFTINTKNSLYIGTSNPPSSLTFAWNKVNDVDNNAVTGYIITNGAGTQIASVGSSTTSHTTSSVPTTTTVYKVYATGSALNGDNASATVNVISVPGQITFISNPSGTTSSNITISWRAPSAVTGASLSYNIYYKIGTNYYYLTNTSSTSYTFDIGKISNGNSFNLSVEAVATANDGGSRVSSKKDGNTLTKAGSFTSASITACWDDSETSIASLAAYVYSRVKINWSAARSSGSSGSTFTYKLYYRVGAGGQWTNVALSSGTVTTATLAIGDSISEGSTISFYVSSTDNYNTTQSSSAVTVIRAIKPELVIGTPTSVSVGVANIPFTWRAKDAAATSWNYNAVVRHGTASDTLATKTLTGSDSASQTIGLNYQLSASATSSILKAFYATVITGKNSKATVTIEVSIWPNGLQNCKTTITKEFNITYLKDIQSLTPPILAYPAAHNTYFNSGSTASIKFSPVGWTDAAGGTTGANIEYVLNYYTGSQSLASPNTSYTFTAPLVDSDASLECSVTAYVKYNDLESPLSKRAVAIMNVAKWTNPSACYLSVVQKNGQNFTGKLVIPVLQYSSATYGNLSSGSYKIYRDGQSGVLVSNNITFSATIQEVSFSFSKPEYASDVNFSLYAEITLTNTDGNSITTKTLNYFIRSSEIDFAARKGCVGINVGSDFITQSDRSALEINAKTGAVTSPVVEIVAESGTVSGKFLDFKIGTTRLGGIKKTASGNNLELDGFVGIAKTVNSLSPNNEGNIQVFVILQSVEQASTLLNGQLGLVPVD